VRVNEGVTKSVNPETGQYTDQIDAKYKPASQEALEAILDADVEINGPGFTRSEWLWFRLPNGDLIFGCFPQEELYFKFEEEYP
jgi:hypothetical protein